MQAAHAKIVQSAKALLEGERDWVANLANVASLLFHDWNPLKAEEKQHTGAPINWLGFYLHKAPNELVLGPFHGQTACIRIQFARGVCGKVASTRTPLVVPDVHEFAGHIACDAASESEIVLPIVQNELLVGVLDVDSSIKDCFNEADLAFLQQIVALLVAGCDFDFLGAAAPQ